MDKTFIFILCFYFCSAKIKITKLDVPSAILYGSQDDVVLDCDFDTGGDTVTELKWFLNGNTLIYQWLPAKNGKAQTQPKFKNHIDVDYKVTNDENTMYRALHITNLTPDFTGNYTCKVSSIESEDEETKRMIVYVVPDDDTIDDSDTNNDNNDDDGDDDIYDDDEILKVSISEETSEITCSAGGFFPQPNLTIYIVNDNDTEIAFRQDDETIELTDDNFYNVTATLQFDLNNLTKKFQYVCELNIPGTPYSINKEGNFSQEGDTDNELEVSEDYIDILNSTNSTESSFEGSKDLETQIEEEIGFLPTTSETIYDDGDDDNNVTSEEIQSINESSSIKGLPSLLLTIVMLPLLSLLNF